MGGLGAALLEQADAGAQQEVEQGVATLEDHEGVVDLGGFCQPAVLIEPSPDLVTEQGAVRGRDDQLFRPEDQQVGVDPDDAVITAGQLFAHQPEACDVGQRQQGHIGALAQVQWHAFEQAVADEPVIEALLLGPAPHRGQAMLDPGSDGIGSVGLQDDGGHGVLFEACAYSTRLVCWRRVTLFGSL